VARALMRGLFDSAAMMTLREYCSADRERLVGLANDEEVSRYMVHTFPCPYTDADAEWWISTGSKQPGAHTRVIEYQGVFVGGVGISLQGGWRDHLGEIGYWVGKEYWGKGIASAALRQMTDYGFADLQLKKLYAGVLAPNTPSMRVLAKCGYELEGVLKLEVRKHGRYFDIHQFARVG
jgi:RimJ/RimL family protein N-acetyltransferase